MNRPVGKVWIKALWLIKISQETRFVQQKLLKVTPNKK